MPARKKYDIITIGSAVWDIFLFLKEEDVAVLDNPREDPSRRELLALEYGAKVHLAGSSVCAGGGGLNTAVTFSRLGYKTAAILALGCDDTASALTAVMEREGLDQSFVACHSTRPTGFSVLLVGGRKHEHVALVERGANDLLTLKGRLPPGAQWCYATSLSGSGAIKVLEKIAGLVRQKKIHWAWNPGREQIEAGLGAIGRFMKQSAVFNLNRDEAVELLRTDQDEIEYLLNELLHWGPKMVLITCGREGAYYADKERRLHIATSEDKVVDSTGAGDAFGSGFVAGLMMTEGKNIEYALRLAMANAESVIGRIGAQAGIIHKRDADKLLSKKYKIRKIK